MPGVVAGESGCRWGRVVGGLRSRCAPRQLTLPDSGVGCRRAAL